MTDDLTPNSSPVRPDRKLAAILAADVVGYSRMMQRDEEGTHDRLRQLLRELVGPAVERHRGRIVKSSGDGLIVEFASAIESVRCAVGLQQHMAAQNANISEEHRLVFRMGLNIGDVMSDNGDIFGDGVNIAARLEALADAGGILVSQTIHDQVEGKVPVRFDDQGERVLKNIARPMRIYRADWSGGASGPGVGLAPVQNHLPEKSSIAVLPFVNMSSDAEQSFFADGLAEDLITDLSKIPGLLVIARNSSFIFKDRSVDVRSIARDLGVRFVVEGSVRRAAGRVRINAQLIEAANGAHIWADRFDSDLADVFQLQDEVVGRIVSALAGVLPSARPTSRQRTTSLEAYDLFIRGRVLAMQSPDGNREARPLLERATELDPQFAEAYAWLAMTHHFGWKYWGDAAELHRTQARVAAERAVELDRQSADAHWILGYVRTYDGDLTGGVAQFETALRINPNHADAWALFADLMVFRGHADDGIECARKAFRLNPYPPGVYYWVMGWAQYAARLYEQAIETLRHDAARGTGSQRLLAASLAQLGRHQEAEQVSRVYLAANPNFSVTEWADGQPFLDNADREHFVDGFIKAGLPR